MLQALFNLAFMLEEGAVIPSSVWTSLSVQPQQFTDQKAMLMELYDRYCCFWSQEGE